MIDEFIYRYKWAVIVVLTLLIIIGGYLIWWENASRIQKTKENQEIAELKAQNELLREQLSQQAAKSVAGAVDLNNNDSDKININIADVTELDKLPGIGPAKAADIIAYRQESGGFQNIEELKEVNGIGDKTFENLKNLVTVGE